MAVRLNHTIVSARDHSASARFLSEILGLSDPVHLGPFAIVQIGDTSLDFMESGGKINTQHYAFLVTELEFDEIFARIRQRGLTYWADPSQKQSGRDQRMGRRPRGLLGGPERPSAGDHHAAVRHRRQPGAQAASAAQSIDGMSG